MPRRVIWGTLIVTCALASTGAGLPTVAEAELVALGDSFSSGEGAPPFESGTATSTNTCHRSRLAWPIGVAARFGDGSVSFACSGAVIAEVVESDPGREEPERQTAQLERLAGVPAVSRVTLTIGGNDVGFREILTKCATKRRCDRTYTKGGRDRIDEKIAVVAGRLPDAYRAIQSAAPAAEVVVVDYPNLFPARPAALTCSALSLIGSKELRYLNAKTERLNDAVETAARSAGVRFVDVETAFKGHEISCRGKDQWANHLRRQGLGVSPSSFHPNARGYARLAELVANALGAPPPVNPPTVRVGQQVTFVAEGFAPGENVSVTLQEGSHVGSNSGAAGVREPFAADDSGVVRATFKWPSRWYTCAGAEYCSAHKWPRGGRVQVQLCGESGCGRIWTRIAR